MSIYKKEDTIIGPKIPTDANRAIGPSLPAHLRRHSHSSDDEKTEEFGPPLPPHMQKKSQSAIGPVLPPHLAVRNVCHSDDEAAESAEDRRDTRSEIGPPMPPRMLSADERNPARRVLGPELPPSMLPNPSEESSEDETYGPDLGLMATTSAADHASVDSWNQRNRSKAEEAPKVERESWMVELPPESAVKHGLGPRTFRAKPAPTGDRSMWTDTPTDVARKQNEPPKKDEKEEMRKQLIAERDREMEKLARKAEKKLKRKESLMDQHTKTIKKKAKEEAKAREGQPAERKRFNREEDMKINRFDDAQKKAMVKRAQLLNDRFSQGESKYL